LSSASENKMPLGSVRNTVGHIVDEVDEIPLCVAHTDAALHLALQICISLCRFAFSVADLHFALQICISRCRFAFRFADLHFTFAKRSRLPCNVLSER